MLPSHLLVGLVVGFVAVRDRRHARLALVVGLTASVLWGVLIAISVERSGDSDWYAGLLGGSGLALVNTIVGAVLGAVAGAVAARFSAADR